MDVRTYQKEIAQFAVYPTDKEELYLITGLSNEVFELLEQCALEIRSIDAVLKEFGDCFWYLTRLFSFYSVELDHSHAELSKNTYGINRAVEIHEILFWGLSRLTGSIKKELRGDKLGDPNLRVAYLCAIWRSLCYWTEKTYGWTLETVLEQNYKKLLDRANRGVIQGDGDNR